MTASDRPNVLFIVMDTARARTVLENDDVMANVRSIAADGTQFTNAFTTGPWTVPSHASMFSGQYTSDHGTHAGTKRFDPDVPTLAERLRTAGYQTVAYSNNTWLSPEFGFDRGFEEFKAGWEPFEGGGDIVSISKEYTDFRSRALAVSRELLKRNGHRTLANGVYAQFLRRRYDDGARVTNWRIKRWLSKHRDGDRPFFLFVNYLEPHLKYDPPAKFCEPFLPTGVDYSAAMAVNQDAWRYVCGDARMTDEDFEVLSALYRGELAYLDHRIGRLYQYLRESGLLEETMIVIAGDHGENLGEHGLMDHQYCLYDTLLHVPLVVRYPDQFPTGARCTELVELRDALPTILEGANVALPDEETVSDVTFQRAVDEGGRGYVLGEYVTPQPSMEDLEDRVGTLPESVRTYDRGLRSVRTTRWKYVEGTDGSVAVYDLESDPDETRNVAEESGDRIERSRELLETELGEFTTIESSESQQVKAATRDRLQDLGYL